jgi:hypothetical protein
MRKLFGLIFAAALLCAGGAQAIELHSIAVPKPAVPPGMQPQLNPHPLPPGIRAPTGGSNVGGPVNRGFSARQ